jgi:hypothetical protein
MSSPFPTFDEFSSAEGPIYTFANAPAFIGFLLLLNVAIGVYFIYSSFTIHQKNASPKNPAVLGILILASAVSFTSSLLNLHSEKQPETAAHRPRYESTTAKKASPFAAIGLMGLGGASAGQMKRRVRPMGSMRSVRSRRANRQSGNQ